MVPRVIVYYTSMNVDVDGGGGQGKGREGGEGVYETR